MSFKRKDVLYHPAFENKAGTFQISHASIDGQYIYTLWTFFPRPLQLDKEISEHFRFLKKENLELFGG